MAKTAKEFDFSFRQFDELRKLAYSYAGIHVTDDKYEMYYARLAKRVRALGFSDFRHYIARVKDDKKEFKEFINAITTNVTSFEREAHHFDFLKSFLQEWGERTFNIWSAGCSSGQEPYSILINILPVCSQCHITPAITATDLDTDVLARAQAAEYPLKDIDDYSLDIKRRFFLRGKGDKSGYARVKPKVVSHVEYQQLNLFYPWKLTKQFDCIFCRNVLIYFEPDKKAEIISRYYNNLTEDGILFLGHSESIPRTDDRWTTIGKNIYQKVGGKG